MNNKVPFDSNTLFKGAFWAAALLVSGFMQNAAATEVTFTNFFGNGEMLLASGQWYSEQGDVTEAAIASAWCHTYYQAGSISIAHRTKVESLSSCSLVVWLRNDFHNIVDGQEVGYIDWPPGFYSFDFYTCSGPEPERVFSSITCK